MTVRGERDNNPGNIRKSDIKFQGEVDGTDPDFKSFESPHYGIRAIARIVLTYYNNHELHTIRQIINRWAPPSENDTEPYVNNVSKACALLPDETIDCTDERILDKIVTAIIHQEEGEVIYDSATICGAVDSALGI